MNAPVLSDAIRRSWERCSQHGLDACTAPGVAAVNRSALAQRLEANARLVSYAQPLIEHLHQSLARTSSLIVLADGDAVVLRIVGDAGLMDRVADISLTAGASWDEATRGTNALALALQEGQAMAVVNDEHFHLPHRFLRGIACPIPNPTRPGHMLGVLGILSDNELSIPHGRALVQNAADLIETRLVETHPEALNQIRVAPSQEALATPLEGILVLDDSGRVLALNRRARQLTGDSQGCPVDEALDLPAQEKQQLLKATPFRPVCLNNRQGQQFWVRLVQDNSPAEATVVEVEFAPTTTQAAPTPASSARHTTETDCPLQALDTGDARMKTAIQRALRVVDRNIPLMIQGETGTGKEVFAQACHLSSQRRLGPFVAINCAAIPGPLIEAELFGYTEGAFTGARQEGSAGKLRDANGGTLFLDEIGDMPLHLQSVLLRVLETRSVTPLGGGEEISLDIAIICASHQPLQEKVNSGDFRADLYFRLSGMALCIPPLRERSDLPTLVKRILAQECDEQPPHISSEALDLLRQQRWPGNIRQLRNVLRLAAALIDEQDHCLRPQHLPSEMTEAAAQPQSVNNSSLRSSEIRLVKEAVARCGGNISAAARELGITRTTLYRKLQQTD